MIEENAFDYERIVSKIYLDHNIPYINGYQNAPLGRDFHVKRKESNEKIRQESQKKINLFDEL